ncbi:MAG: IS200/IS605 family transposase [Pyrinomonadaceae bacterium MAG19_C2-C3]|nr:IS200/IS605 family transposase [Pyrinomonadaceae bacterium MAG19_C2-C3]
MAHTYTDVLIHIIFSTKDRYPFLKDELLAETHSYIGGIVRNLKGKPVRVGGVADHVHLLAWLPPTITISDAARDIKANSSRWISGQGVKDFAWQRGYAAFSVSHSNIGQVAQYIVNQAAHHRRMTFKEEYIKFLKAHGVVYDERFVFSR